MDLVADLLDAAAIGKRPPGNPCKIGTALLALGEEERARARAVILDGNVSASLVAAALERNGIPVAGQTVSTHRRGGCQWCRRAGLGPEDG